MLPLPVRAAALLCVSGSKPVSLQPGPSSFGWVFLGFNICAALICGAERAGMRGMQALGLPVYSKGFLQGRPPASPPPPSRLPFRDFSHFCPACCFGNGSRARHMGASCSIPEFFPTAHIIPSVLICGHLGHNAPEINSMTSSHRKLKVFL